MKKTERIDYGSGYTKVREYVINATSKGFSIQGALGQLLIKAVEHDALNVRRSSK